MRVKKKQTKKHYIVKNGKFKETKLNLIETSAHCQDKEIGTHITIYSGMKIYIKNKTCKINLL